MAAQEREAVVAADPQRGAVEAVVGERHPARLVERVGAVGGLGLAAYGGDDRERGLGVVAADATDAQDRRSVVATSSADAAAGRSAATGLSLAGSTNR